MMKKRVITFGEIMLRLNPVGYYRLVQASQFESSYAGGEANVAVSLANYGMSAAFVTKVPEHEIGQCAVNAMRQFGVDTTHMYRGGSRLGVYYAEKGASQRPSKVIYDRAGSSIATAKPEEFQWDEIFRDGSISQALLLRWEVIYRRFVWTPARLQRKGALLFPAI